MGSRKQRSLLGYGFRTPKERRNSCLTTPLENCPPICGEGARITAGSPRKRFDGWLPGSESWGRQQSLPRGLGDPRGANPGKKKKKKSKCSTQYWVYSKCSKKL